MAYWRIKLIIMDTMLTPDLLQILCCPICREELVQTGQDSSLLCTSCSTAYPVVEGVPVLDTTPLTKSEAL